MLQSPYLDAGAVLTFRNECAAEGRIILRIQESRFQKSQKKRGEAAVRVCSKDRLNMQGLDERCRVSV